MYGFCSDGLRPLPSAGATGVANGLAAHHEQQREERRDAAHDRRHPGRELAVLRRRLARTTTRREPVRIGSHSSSEPGLLAPERREAVAAAAASREVCRGDDVERKSWRRNADQEDGSRPPARRRSRRTGRAARALDDAPVAPARRRGARRRGVEREPEREDERAAAEERHGLSPGPASGRRDARGAATGGQAPRAGDRRSSEGQSTQDQSGWPSILRRALRDAACRGRL